MRFRLVAVVLASALMLSGCWSRRELTDVSFAGVLGFDWVDGQYLVTLNIHTPRSGGAQQDSGGKGGGGGGEPSARNTWTISERAPSPDAAMARLDQILQRSLTLSHVRSIIFGEEMARHGIAPVMDFLLRSVEIRPTAWVGVTNGTAQELLAARPRQGLMTDGPLGYHDAAQWRSSITPARRLTKVANILQEEGVDLTLPLFRRGGMEPPKPEQAQEEGSLASKPEAPDEIIYGGAAAFRGDKLVAWLTPLEARGHMWGIDQVTHGAVTADCPTPRPDQRVIFRLRSSHGRSQIDFTNGKPKGIVRVKVVADVNDITCQEFLVQDGDTQRLRDVLAERVRKSIRDVLDVARNSRSDIFGFGQNLFRRAPAAFRSREAKWDNVLEEMSVAIEVNVQVVRLGQLNRRFRFQGVH